MNQDLTDFFCSVCFNNKGLTQIQGTIICKTCLEKAVEAHKNTNNQKLTTTIEEVLEKENDVYQ